MKKIFVSFPYTHTDKHVTLERLRRARAYCLELINQGHAVFAPAVFGHDIVTLLELPETNQDMTFKKWDQFCYAYMLPCEEFHLLNLHGYKESTGCAGELEKAKELNMVIKNIDCQPSHIVKDERGNVTNTNWYLFYEKN